MPLQGDADLLAREADVHRLVPDLRELADVAHERPGRLSTVEAAHVLDPEPVLPQPPAGQPAEELLDPLGLEAHDDLHDLHHGNGVQNLLHPGHTYFSFRTSGPSWHRKIDSKLL